MQNIKTPDVIINARTPTETEDLIVLAGFPGSGLVGSISLSYLVDELQFTQIGTITSKFFPPMAMMSEGVIAVPVRIYEKDKFLVILADIPIQPTICYELAEALFNWIKNFKITEIVTVAGIVTNTAEKKVFCVTTEKELLEKIGENAIKLEIGSISGIASSILVECKVRGIPGIGLLGEAINAPDPRAAAAALNVLNILYGFNVNTDSLIEQAEEIESQMHQLSEEVEAADEQPVRREQLPMYG